MKVMDNDSLSLFTTLDIYSDESTMKSEYGNILQIKTDNNQINKY